MPELDKRSEIDTQLSHLKNQPKALRQMLEVHNIESRPLWKPIHLQPLFRDSLCIQNGTSQSLFEKGLCLPSGTQMTHNDVEYVSALLKKVLK
jgi:UDP-N-acetylbacillosamine transaminase